MEKVTLNQRVWFYKNKTFHYGTVKRKASESIGKEELYVIEIIYPPEKAAHGKHIITPKEHLFFSLAECYQEGFGTVVDEVYNAYEKAFEWLEVKWEDIK